ncbi:MAG: MarR family winged helix-turn-helix transcriptional regulator [Nocardioides sp.]
MSEADPPAEDLADVAALGDELLRLQRRRTSVYDGVVLDNSAFRLLWLLSDGVPRTLRQLAEGLDLEQSTVNRQVNAALAAGYLERFAEQGSRGKLLRPSPRGEQAYGHDGLIRAELISRALADLGAGRAERLIEDLRLFNDAWDRALSRGDRDPGMPGPGA